MTNTYTVNLNLKTIFLCPNIKSVELWPGLGKRHLLVCRFVRALVETRTTAKVDKLSVVNQRLQC